MNNRELGAYGEDLAVNFLRQHGYNILERNYWCCYGEIDLITQVKDYLSFVEVKFCSQHNFIPPHEQIHPQKQEKIKKVAQHYLSFRNFNLDFRFDVVLIVDDTPTPKINLIKNAFWIKERI